MRKQEESVVRRFAERVRFQRTRVRENGVNGGTTEANAWGCRRHRPRSSHCRRMRHPPSCTHRWYGEWRGTRGICVHRAQVPRGT
ncbi:hypothetical protein B0H12DRAFT_1262915 [Mycena haematopus]|nr:hypothetical protein B0H12DRAFT_1262915 [Mycena haematopus]